MIIELLENKSIKEKANIKATKIVELNFGGEYEDALYGIKVEIQKISKIEGGIEIMAMAWKGSKQLGFGKNGKVEIERFRIYNPPILINDPNGTVVRDYLDLTTGEAKHRRLKEDSLAAIKRTLAHTISVAGKEDTQIIKGKIGNTTSTFFPDPSVEVTTVDGHSVVNGNALTWADLRASAGAAADDAGALVSFARIKADGTTDRFDDMRRSFLLFDTSSIPDTDPIVSATFSFVVEVGNKTDGMSLSISLVASTIASNTAVAASDYEGTVGNTTKFASDRTIAGITADGATYNDMALNASGLAAISKTGVTKLGGKMANDVDNSAPTWSADADANLNINSADVAGTSEDPKLVVVHGSDFRTEIIIM